jgi:hypothetical protein
MKAGVAHAVSPRVGKLVFATKRVGSDERPWALVRGDNSDVFNALAAAR